MAHLGASPSASTLTHAINERSAVDCLRIPAPTWLYSNAELDATPSIAAGMSCDDERRLRREACGFIVALANEINSQMPQPQHQPLGHDSRQRLSMQAQLSAMVSMHRMYMHHSFQDLDFRDLSATLLFLSSKMEECPQSFDRVVKIWYLIRSGGEKVSSQSPEFQEMKEYFNTMEENLLLTMAFDLRVHTPHECVVKFMYHAWIHDLVEYNCSKRDPPVKITQKDLGSAAYEHATAMLQVTTLCVQHPAVVLAAACLHCVFTHSGVEIVPCAQYGKNWWRLIAPDLDLDTLDQIAIEYQTKSKLFQADIEEFKKRPAREVTQKRMAMPEGQMNDTTNAMKRVKTEPTIKIDVKQYMAQRKDVRKSPQRSADGQQTTRSEQSSGGFMPSLKEVNEVADLAPIFAASGSMPPASVPRSVPPSGAPAPIPPPGASVPKHERSRDEQSRDERKLKRPHGHEHRSAHAHGERIAPGAAHGERRSERKDEYRNGRSDEALHQRSEKRDRSRDEHHKHRSPRRHHSDHHREKERRPDGEHKRHASREASHDRRSMHNGVTTLPRPPPAPVSLAESKVLSRHQAQDKCSQSQVLPPPPPPPPARDSTDLEDGEIED